MALPCPGWVGQALAGQAGVGLGGTEEWLAALGPVVSRECLLASVLCKLTKHFFWRAGTLRRP